MSTTKLCSLNNTLLYYDCLLAYKTSHNYFNSDDLNSVLRPKHFPYSLRNPRLVLESSQKLNISYYSAYNRIKKLWNVIPQRIKSLSLGRYKTAIRSMTNVIGHSLSIYENNPISNLSQ